MGLTATDEAYDITSYVSSSLFEVSEVMGSSSSRDGRTSVFYGLERLSQVRESATSAFIHDGRGSVAQTILGGAIPPGGGMALSVPSRQERTRLRSPSSATTQKSKTRLPASPICVLGIMTQQAPGSG